MTTNVATDALNRLFDLWTTKYEPASRGDFHRDGIIDEETWLREHRRVLFVLLEPNSRGGRYNQFRGWDLREVFGRVMLGKPVDVNLALWTRLLLDNRTDFAPVDREEAGRELRRVAVINLKKIAGSGNADYDAIQAHAWDDRTFIREQVKIITPTVIVTCGNRTNQIFARVMEHSPWVKLPDDAPWTVNGVRVLPVMHPSQRDGGVAAFQRMWTVAHQAGLVEATPGAGDSEPAEHRRKHQRRQSVRTSPSAEEAAWVLRPYPHLIDRQREFLSKGVVAVGWPGLGDITADSRDVLLEKLRKAYADRDEGWYSRSIATLTTLRDEIGVGDPVILAPRTGDSMAVWIGRVTSGYRYDPSCDGEVGYPHQRTVSWIRQMPRRELPPALARTLKGRRALFRAYRRAVEEVLAEHG